MPNRVGLANPKKQQKRAAFRFPLDPPRNYLILRFSSASWIVPATSVSPLAGRQQRWGGRRVPDGLVGVDHVASLDREAGHGDPRRRRAPDQRLQRGDRGGSSLIVRTLRRDALDQVALRQFGGYGVAEIHRRHR